MTSSAQIITDDQIDLQPISHVLKALKFKTQQALISVLQKTQDIYGYLPQPALQEIAYTLKVPMAGVYGVCTFYTQFRLKPLGRHIIRVCDGTACHVRSSTDLLEDLRAQLGIHPGETTEDGLFSFETVMCIGACGLAPVVMIGEETYGKLTPKKLDEIIANYRQKS